MEDFNFVLKCSREEGNYVFISYNLLTVGFICVSIKIHSGKVKILPEAIID